MRLEAGQSRTEQREQQVFLTPPTGRNLDEIRREAGEAGAEFLRQQFQQQERELARSLTRQYREYQRFYQSVSDLAVSAAFGQIESFTDAAKQFVIAATRDLVRLAIQRQVTAAKEIAIDTAVTNARIANQQRLPRLNSAYRRCKSSVCCRCWCWCWWYRITEYRWVGIWRRGCTWLGKPRVQRRICQSFFWNRCITH